jgi:hypothetical protein
LAFVPILILSFDLVCPAAAHAPCVGSQKLPPLHMYCRSVLSSCQREAAQCGAVRGGATARPKVFEEPPELGALPLLIKCEKAPPLQPLHSWPFTTVCTKLTWLPSRINVSLCVSTLNTLKGPEPLFDDVTAKTRPTQ